MKKCSKRGFTLIELLVVVLIIGILSAIAVPQYQKAVLKSRFSSLMPTTQAIRDGNEMYYMTNGGYADALAKLDVTTANTEDMTITVNNNSDYAYTMSTRPNISNNLVMYQKHSGNFAGNVHCEALTENTAAKKLCQNLGGIELGKNGDYTAYRLSGNSVGEFPPNFTQSCSGTTCTYTYDNGYVIKDYASSGSLRLNTGKEDFASRVYVTDPNPTGSDETFWFDEDGNVIHLSSDAHRNGYAQALGLESYSVELAEDGTPILYHDSHMIRLPGAGGIYGGNWRLHSLEFYEDGSIKKVTGAFNNDRIYFSYLPGGVPADSNTPAFESFNLEQTFQYKEILAHVQEVTSKTKCEMFPDIASCQ